MVIAQLSKPISEVKMKLKGEKKIIRNKQEKSRIEVGAKYGP